MAAEPLHRLVQTLRITLDSDDLTNAELLARYRKDRDPAAVEAIVRRHGPRVLAACRKVLGADIDAEDAFQATFLVLLRNPAAVRRTAALGAWLYGVAHRISLQARARRLRRERLEVGAGAKRQPEPDLPWREACAILHEELDRLPDATRLPLVLCYLEGLSRDEAAQQLGRTLNSVKKALEKGREVLRKRLARRGVTLSAGLLSAVAAPVSEASDVSRAVVDGVIRPSASVAALARAFRPAVPVRTVVAACLGVAAVSIGLAVADGPKPPDPPPREQPVRAVAQEAPPAKAPAAKPPAAGPEPREPAPVAKPADPPPDVFSYRGRAVTLEGKPVEGAQVFLHITSLDPKPLVPRARTDTDGRFSFDVRRSELDPRGYELSAEPWRNGHLIGSAPGLGVAWSRDLTPGQDAELLFVKDDAPIERRVLNLEGKPVAGARVRTLWVLHPAGGNLDAWLDGLSRIDQAQGLWKALDGLEGVSRSSLHTNSAFRQHGFNPAIAPVQTGADGRFTVRGIGRERVALIQIEGEGIASRPVAVTTRQRDPVTVPAFSLQGITSSRELNVRPTEPILGARFEVAVGPDRPIIGTVTDVDTGRPVAGATIRLHHFSDGLMDDHRARALSGPDGRFRLNGLPGRKWTTLLVERPADQPYLPVTIEVPDQAGLGPIELNLRLKRGVWLTGRVLDRDTNRPVPIEFGYGAELDNPHLPAVREYGYEFNLLNRLDDGGFRTAILPGRGYFGVRWRNGDQLAYELGQGVPFRGVPPTKPHSFSAQSDYAVVRLDVPPEKTEVVQDVVLTPGRSAPVKCCGPDGEALDGVVVTAGLDGAQTETLGRNGTVQVRPRQFLQAVHPEQKLAGRLQLMGTEKGSMTLTLEPWRVATGRILDAAGQPVAGAVLSFGGGEPSPADGEPEGFWYKGQPVRTDDKGVYRIEGLVPGAPYTVLVWAKGRPGQVIRFRADWKAGEVKDLGDLKPGQ